VPAAAALIGIGLESWLDRNAGRGGVNVRPISKRGFQLPCGSRLKPPIYKPVENGLGNRIVFFCLMRDVGLTNLFHLNSSHLCLTCTLVIHDMTSLGVTWLSVPLNAIHLYLAWRSFDSHQILIAF